MSHDIPAGLDWVPRRPDDYAGFRRSLRRTAGRDSGLEAWSGRQDGLGDDFLGLFLDLWAVTCDRLALYDEVLANESYLRTARRTATVVALVDLLGYTPTPAVAAELDLALTATGAAPIAVPAGTGFLATVPGAGAQRFELDQPTTAQSAANRSVLQPVADVYLAGLAGGSLTALLLRGGGRRPLLPRLLWLHLPGDPSPWRLVEISGITEATDATGAPAWRLVLTASLNVGPAVPLATVRLLRPTQRAGLWRVAGSSTVAVTSTQVILDGIHRRIAAGDAVVVQRGTGISLHRVTRIDEAAGLLPAPAAATLTTGGVTTTIQAGVMSMGVTRLTLDLIGGTASALLATVAAGDDAGAVWHGLVPVGTVVAQSTDPGAWSLDPRFARVVAAANGAVTLLVAGATGDGGAVSGTVAGTGTDARFAPDPDATMPSDPVLAHGNLVRASRGTLVRGEVLGSGDAGVASQRFKPKQQPLTYRRDPASASGVRPELVLRVSGEPWQVVSSFHRHGPHDRVFVLNHDAAGDTWIVFGDGVRGSRLPSGAGNVVIDYRHGAGAAVPDPGAALQPNGAPAGIAGARLIGPARGGADAEDAGATRLRAPRSALVLGRAVSARDVEALALAEAGVFAALATWRWDVQRQRVVVALTFAGAAALTPLLAERLRGRLDPEAVVVVAPAAEVPLHLVLGIGCQARRSLTVVRDAVLAALAPPDGVLAPAALGIGRPLWRSHLAAAVAAVPGVRALTALAAAVDGAVAMPFGGAYLSPGPASRFVPTLTVTVTELPDA